jgi:CHAD domain-containing protein
VVANADALRGTPAIEHLHQARVALRRMRSAIRLLDAQGTDVPRSIVRRLQQLAHVLGAARDWDVLCEDTLPALLASCAPDARTVEVLEGTSRSLRSQSMTAVVKAVGSRRYARLVLGLGTWSMSASPPSPRLADSAAVLLGPLADDLAAGARAFARLSRHDRHRVRIHAKRLRYALDLLRFALPAKSAADYLDALATLQDTLGALNDATVTRERLVRAISLRTCKRLVKDWVARVEPALVRKASRELNALARRKRPWPVDS